MLEIDNTLLFLNLSRKARVVWKRFVKFQGARKTHRDGTLLGIYPSRDLYTEADWSVYEIRMIEGLGPDPKSKYVALIWDYIAPTQRGIPMGDLEYFQMRPATTTLAYKPIHYYQSDLHFMGVLKRLHPKFTEFIRVV